MDVIAKRVALRFLTYAGNRDKIFIHRGREYITYRGRDIRLFRKYPGARPSVYTVGWRANEKPFDTLKDAKAYIDELEEARAGKK